MKKYHVQFVFALLLSVVAIGSVAAQSDQLMPMSINSPKANVNSDMPMSINRAARHQVYVGNNTIQFPGIAGNYIAVVNTNFTLVELMLQGNHIPVTPIINTEGLYIFANAQYYTAQMTVNGKVIKGVLALGSDAQGQHLLYTDVW